MPIEVGAIARQAAAAFGGTPTVTRHHDEAEVNWVDIVACPDRPLAGITSYATIGLSRHDNRLESDGKSLRVELVGACASVASLFPEMLATCALGVSR